MVGAVIALAIACCVLALSTAVLAGSMPWLWWKCFRQEERINQLDEVLSETLRAMGVPSEEELEQQQHAEKQHTDSNGMRFDRYSSVASQTLR